MPAKYNIDGSDIEDLINIVDELTPLFDALDDYLYEIDKAVYYSDNLKYPAYFDELCILKSNARDFLLNNEWEECRKSLEDFKKQLEGSE